MAVRRKTIECECGEVFVDHRSHIEGNLKFGPWKARTHRVRETKSKSGGDILVALWDRTVECGKCGGELLKEKRQYELTPPADVKTPEPIGSYSSRDLIIRTGAGTSEAETETRDGILRMKA